MIIPEPRHHAKPSHIQQFPLPLIQKYSKETGP